MELEEIQATWAQMSVELEKQKHLTNEIIMKMTQDRYKNKFSKVSFYESLGAVICFAAAIYILFNFNELQGWLEIVCGIFTLGFLILMPVLVLNSLRAVQRLKIGVKTYKETLIEYTAKKKRLLILQQVGIYASFVLAFTMMPVASRIFSNKDFFAVSRGLPFYLGISVALIALFFYARWGYGCYKRITNSAEELLQEIE
ncbi:hypothetical protein [Maribacter sp. HTCC2170]|uniref:hypothetical protein n=1 Tax=Maribacter sp. (strain HTCC2170 / KCCM 42371) TaxID=313603 RepID=UPI00006AFD6E|nr:hypothetical protein [Maribacter sp. HTCC2170]EAR01333.1 hypothetical protein FB2170_11451 [Maribacter sp. HTCC2170]